MKLFLLFISMVWISTATATDAPVITIRKGTAVTAEIRDLGGPAGPVAATVLRNDLSLSGAISLGDSNSATIVISGTATGGGLEASATEKSGSKVLQKNYAGGTRTTVHQFVDDLIETLTGQKGIATSRIAFVANRTGHKEIYTADYDGQNLLQLTRDNAISVNPNLSADGHRLAYTGYQSGYADIYLVDLRNGSRNRAVKYPGTNSGPAISPDGNRLACTMSKDGSPAIYVVGLAGDNPRRLSHGRGVESSPTWSPNGGELIYSSDAQGSPQLYRISASGGSGRLLSTGFSYCTEPDWSPDGKKVIFNVRSGGSFQVAVLDLGGGGTKIASSEGERPYWGPDSRHAIFARGNQLVMIDTVTGREARIVSDLGRISEPTWSH